MIQLVIRLDPAPGRLAELDQFLGGVVGDCVKEFHAKQACIYEDVVVGWPEREIRLDFDKMADLETMLTSERWKEHKNTLLKYGTGLSSQILRPSSCA